MTVGTESQSSRFSATTGQSGQAGPSIVSPDSCRFVAARQLARDLIERRAKEHKKSVISILEIACSTRRVVWGKTSVGEMNVLSNFSIWTRCQRHQ